MTVELRRTPSFARAARLLVGAVAWLFAGCGGPSQAIPVEFTKPPPPPAPFTAGEALSQFDVAPDPDYRLGEGDSITIQVWDRPDLSGMQVVGPDGAITVPVAGTLRVSGLTREEATKAVKEAMTRFYAKITVTVRVDRYASNRVVVLGQVRLPGVIQFDAMPTLLEALARAGGVPINERSNLTHCAIVRGRDRVAWIDLRALLQDANLSLNVRLKPNDVVFIPELSDLPVYVLGQVHRPGLYRRTPSMTLLEVIGLAGGATRDAASTFHVVSPSRGLSATVAFDDLVKGIQGRDVVLQGGDIVYMPSSTLADIGYVFEKLNPFGWVFLGATVRSGIVE